MLIIMLCELFYSYYFEFAILQPTILPHFHHHVDDKNKHGNQK